MSGGVAQRKHTVREHRSSEHQMKRELKLLNKIKKLEGKKRTKKENKMTSHPYLLTIPM